MFAAILFDLDNTLIDRDAAFYKLVSRTFSDPSLIEELVKLDQGGYGDRMKLLSRWEELGAGKLDMPAFGRALSLHISPDPRLLESLNTLKSTTTIGILTNGGRISQQSKWRAAGLDSVVPRDRLWISKEIGFAKPQPAAFQYACTKLNVSLENCLFVGDQPVLDIEGAQSVGMSTMLVSNPLSAEVIYQDLISRTCCEP